MKDYEIMSGSGWEMEESAVYKMRSCILWFAPPPSISLTKLFLLETIFGQKLSNNLSFQGHTLTTSKSIQKFSTKNFLLAFKDADDNHWRNANVEILENHFFPIMFYACYVFCASRPPTAALWLHLLGIRKKSKTQKCSWEGGTSQQAIKQYMCNWKQPNWYGAHKSKQFTLPNSHSSPKLTHHPDTPDILDHLQTIAKYFSNITNADTASTSRFAMLQCTMGKLQWEFGNRIFFIFDFGTLIRDEMNRLNVLHYYKLKDLL